MDDKILIDYWYLGIVAVILGWEIVRFILKRLLRRFLNPIKKLGIKIFGNPKIVNLELLAVLLIAVGFIIYLLIAG